jgi:membrane associated rhomboid family serine protease
MFRLSPIVKNLIIINVIVFFAQSIMPILTQWLSLYNVNTPYFKPYQLFTYMFCHADFMHIFFNMLILSSFGPILEEFWGQKRFTMFYTICGVGAGMFNIVMDLFFGIGTFSAMIGASGAVYGVMTAFGLIFPDMELRLMLLPISFKAKYMVMVMGGLAIYSGFKATPGDNVAHFAHLGGIVIAIIFVQVWGRASR